MVRIGNSEVGYGSSPFVVAEIGINHNGSMALVKKLIDAAVEAGCDAVKFQKRTVPVVYSAAELAKDREVPVDVIANAIKRGVLSKEAVMRLTESNLQKTTNGDLKFALEFTEREYQEINRYCCEKNVHWFASPWDEESVDFLEKFDPPCYKIASASLTDDGLLRHIRAKGRPVILSTGMSTTEQIDHAVEVLGREDLVLLSCVSTYPAELRDINLFDIVTMRSRYEGIPVGYSGHEKGVYTSLCAVVLGACMVERHLTLDRTMWGSDQAASLEPKGMELLISEINNFQRAKGDGVKRVLEAEIPIMKKLRRK